MARHYKPNPLPPEHRKDDQSEKGNHPSKSHRFLTVNRYGNKHEASAYNFWCRTPRQKTLKRQLGTVLASFVNFFRYRFFRQDHLHPFNSSSICRLNNEFKVFVAYTAADIRNFAFHFNKHPTEGICIAFYLVKQ